MEDHQSQEPEEEYWDDQDTIVDTDELEDLIVDVMIPTES